MAGRYAHAKQYKRMRKQLKFLRNRLGRVIRDVERNTANDPEISAAFTSTLRKARIIAGQNLNRHAKPKINSWDAPEVECIGKRNGRTPYEFACKATIASTDGLVPRVERLFFRQMLGTVPVWRLNAGGALKQTAALTAITPKRAHVDKEHRRQKLKMPDPASGLPTRPPWRIFISGQKVIKPNLEGELARRSAINRLIGHMKADHRISKTISKATQPTASTSKFNFRRILK